MDYSYPLSSDWSTDEIINVTAFYDVVEKGYEDGLERSLIISAYREFKVIVPSKSEEKTLFKEFEKASGYSSYQIVKLAQEKEDGEIVKGKQR